MQKIFLAVFVFAATAATAFEWPQTIESPDALSVHFAKERGGNFSSGIGFASAANVYASEKSTLLMRISPSRSLSEFDSPLGNALIFSKDDGVLTVYGNLKEVFFDGQTESAQAGIPLGESGSSGWSGDGSGCEFQLLDSKTKTALNPFSILDLIAPNEIELTGNVEAVSQSGASFSLVRHRQTLKSGTYSIFCEIPAGMDIQKTELDMNGERIDVIDFNTLLFSGSRLCATGSSLYDCKSFFRKRMQFVGKIRVMQGASNLTVTIVDVFGRTYAIHCGIDAV